MGEHDGHSPPLIVTEGLSMEGGRKENSYTEEVISQSSSTDRPLVIFGVSTVSCLTHVEMILDLMSQFTSISPVTVVVTSVIQCHRI